MVGSYDIILSTTNRVVGRATMLKRAVLAHIAVRWWSRMPAAIFAIIMNGIAVPSPAFLAWCRLEGYGDSDFSGVFLTASRTVSSVRSYTVDTWRSWAWVGDRDTVASTFPLGLTST